MVNIIQNIVFYILIAKLLMTLYQRKYNETGAVKRFASFYQSALVGGLYASITAIKVKELPVLLVYVAILIAVVIGVVLRKKLFPYGRKCESCGKQLKIRKILFEDSQKCSQCEN